MPCGITKLGDTGTHTLATRDCGPPPQISVHACMHTIDSVLLNQKMYEKVCGVAILV